MLVTIMYALHVLTYSTLITILQSRNCDYPHLIIQEPEAQRG